MKISISNVVKGFCAVLLWGVLAVSCRKDPIFHFISTETAPVPPRIEGSPTNMVVFQRTYQYLSDPDDPASTTTETANLLFVASGRLHWYGGPDPQSPGWDRNYGIPQPGGRIISLAVTEDRLYALCLNGSSLHTTLRYIGQSGDKWETVNTTHHYSLIQSIYSAYSDGDTASSQLFVGACRGDAYALLYVDKGSNTLKTLKEDTGMLSGAAYRDNTYYLCTRKDGIFKIENLGNSSAKVSQLENIREAEVKIESENSDSDDTDSDDTDTKEPDTQTVIQRRSNKLLFMGMIRLKDANKSIIAIERDGGALYEILTDDVLTTLKNKVTDTGSDPDSLTLLNKCQTETGAFWRMSQINNEGKPIRSITTGSYAMGALALWEDTDHYRKRLVVGRQGTLYSTSYNNGYVEFNIDPYDSSFDKTDTDRSSMITVDNRDRYSTNLGKHPVNHLFQTPEDIDVNMTFFASTQAAGLWSYRDRPSNGGLQWNAEN